MGSGQNEDVEAAIRAACGASDYDEATTLVLEKYGPELYGFLMGRVRDEGDADEIFSNFSIDLWQGLPKFEWRCPARVWAYTLLRHAANRYFRAPQREPRRNIPLSQASQISKLAAAVRTRTATALRSGAKSQLAALREQLSPEDQTILILRIDKEMSWTDLARVMTYDGREPDDDELTREAARVRKRFQLAKSRLAKMARKAGLLERRD